MVIKKLILTSAIVLPLIALDACMLPLVDHDNNPATPPKQLTEEEARQLVKEKVENATKAASPMFGPYQPLVWSLGGVLGTVAAFVFPFRKVKKNEVK